MVRTGILLAAFAGALVPLLATATTVLPAPPVAQPDAGGRGVPLGGAERLTPMERDQTLDHIAQLIQDHYVFKNVAQKVAVEIRAWKTDSELTQAADKRSLASILTERLRKVDRHFSVDWTAHAKVEPSVASTAGQSSRAQKLAHDNYGFEAVEHLPGNVGYVRMSMFAGFDTTVAGDKTPAARAAGEAVLTLLQSSDAVIFDLRQNHGGSAAMIDLLLSGFFGEEPLLLNRFYEREGDRTTDYTTLANFSGRRRPDVPVFVLISGGTASAAEEFAYDVKAQKRGVVVGEPSYGGANPGEDFDAGGGFTVFISTAAAINPITHTNWDGIGVQPDIVAPAEQALKRAHALALEAVLAHGGPEDMQTEARWALERLEAERKGRRVAPLAASGFVGTYAGNYGDRKIAIENGQLVYQNAQFPALKLVLLHDDAFALDGRADTRIRFERNAKGRVVTMFITGTDAVTSAYTRR
jgi:hypothetical protein